MLTFLLLQDGGVSLDASTGTALTAVLGLTTTILGMLVVAQNNRVRDKEGEISRMAESHKEALVSEREGRAKAERREDDALAREGKLASTVAELASALREAATIVKDAATESRAAHLEARRANEVLERQDRRSEGIERLLQQIAYRWPAGIPPPSQPGD